MFQVVDHIDDLGSGESGEVFGGVASDREQFLEAFSSCRHTGYRVWAMGYEEMFSSLSCFLYRIFMGLPILERYPLKKTCSLALMPHTLSPYPPPEAAGRRIHVPWRDDGAGYSLSG